MPRVALDALEDAFHRRHRPFQHLHEGIRAEQQRAGDALRRVAAPCRIEDAGELDRHLPSGTRLRLA